MLIEENEINSEKIVTVMKKHQSLGKTSGIILGTFKGALIQI